MSKKHDQKSALSNCGRILFERLRCVSLEAFERAAF